jgi:outer membrane biosynthesis protein TonB
MNVKLRAARSAPLAVDIFNADRQRLALFLILSAWAHLLTFMALGGLGLDRWTSPPDLNWPVERFVELNLELSSPPNSEPPQALKAPTLHGRPPSLPPSRPTDAAHEQAPTSEELEDSTAYPLLPAQAAPSSEAAEPTEPASRSDTTINVEETAPRFKSYSATVRSAVARRWILPPEARVNFQPGRFTAVMTLERDGQVAMIFVEESSGSASLDSAATAALWGAAPYEPFPPELSEHDRLNFRLHFDYQAVVRKGLPSRLSGQ